MVAALATLRCCYALGVSAPFFSLVFAGSERVPASIVGAPMGFFEATGDWVAEVQQLSLVQRKAFYRKSADAQVLRQEGASRPRLIQEDATTAAGLAAVLTRSDGMLYDSPLLTLLQTDAAAVDAEGTESAAYNRSSLPPAAVPNPAVVSPASRSLDAGVSTVKGGSPTPAVEARLPRVQNVSVPMPAGMQMLPAEDAPAEATALPPPHALSNRSVEGPARDQQTPRGALPGDHGLQPRPSASPDVNRSTAGTWGSASAPDQQALVSQATSPQLDATSGGVGGAGGNNSATRSGIGVDLMQHIATAGSLNSDSASALSALERVVTPAPPKAALASLAAKDTDVVAAGLETHVTKDPRVAPEILEPQSNVALTPAGTIPANFLLIAMATSVLIVMAFVSGTSILFLHQAGVLFSSARGARTSAIAAHAYVAGLPVFYSRHIDKHLPKSSGYDCSFSKPVSSGRALRLQVRVESPLCGVPLTAPLSQKPCVLYSASVSSPSHEGVNPMSVAYAADSQPFIVSLLDAPDVRIEVRGDEVSLFEMSEGLRAESAHFNSVPNHWQAFAISRRLSATHHSPPLSRLYAEDPVLDFQECALHVGSIITCVGELRRREDGVLTLHPWLSHLGETEPAGRRSGKASPEPPCTPAPAGCTFTGRVFASDAVSLIRPPRDPGFFAKFGITWGSTPSRRGGRHVRGSIGTKKHLSTAASDDEE